MDERDRGTEEGVGGHALRVGSSRRSGGRRLRRDFWIYFAGQGISQLGSSFTAFARGSWPSASAGRPGAGFVDAGTFVTTALETLVVSGIAVTAMAWIGRYPAALGLWAVASGFGLLLNIDTAALRQAIVPNHLFGRVISVAGVLAWSAIPLGALAGAAAISLTSVRTVYAGIGVLTALIAAGFALSPIRHGDRVIAAARERSTAHTG
jgi:hypothetical protein